MMKDNDSILVFEYFTASGEKDKCIISEAEELIFALLDDLKDFNVDLVINKSYENIVNHMEDSNILKVFTYPYGTYTEDQYQNTYYSAKVIVEVPRIQ